MEEEKKEIVKEDTKKEEKRKVKKEKGKFCEKIISKAKKIRKKTFATMVLILSVVVVALLVLMIVNCSFAFGNVSKGKMKSLATEFFQENFGVNSSITDNMTIKQVSGVYEITLLGEYPFYFTKDGQFIMQETGLIPTKPESATSNPTTNVPKSDAEKDNCSANIATTTGFDIEAIEELAFSAEGITMLKEQEAISTKYGVSGSPTLIINGVKSSAIYSGTDTTKAAICSAFTAKPSECNGVTTNSSWTAKSAKPVVELFVMSYCPYGVRAEENIAPLQELFGSKIDLKIRYIINVNGETIDKVNSLHGITEAKEDARQLAIAKLYPNKLWDYLAEFNRVCYGGGAASSGSC